MPKFFEGDDITIIPDNDKKTIFSPIFEVMAATDPKIEALLVTQLTSNFQGLFVGTLNSKSENMGEKALAVLKQHQKTDRERSNLPPFYSK